jgi:hypothetical protein
VAVDMASSCMDERSTEENAERSAARLSGT